MYVQLRPLFVQITMRIYSFAAYLKVITGITEGTPETTQKNIR